MKNKKYLKLWGIWAVLVFIVTVITRNYNTPSPLLMIANYLRRLSLSSTLGNIISLILYGLLGLLPLGILFFRKEQTRLQKLLLVTLSIVLFFGMYLLINHYLIFYFFNPVLAGEELVTFFNFIFTALVFTIIVSYWVMEIIHTSSHIEPLIKNINVTLCILGMVLVVSVLGFNLNELMQSISEHNVFPNVSLSTNENLDGFYLLFRYGLDGLPVVLSLLVISKVIELLEQIRIDRHAQETVSLVINLSKITTQTVIITILANIFGNIVIFLLSRKLSHTALTIDFPFYSLLFALSVLFTSKFILENKALKEENEQFI